MVAGKLYRVVKGKKQKGYKSYRRGYRRKRRTMPIGGFPNTKVVKLRYTEIKSLNPGAGLLTNNKYYANGAYDVDFTGIGHQPRGFDIWAKQYEHWVVLGSKITVEWTPTTSIAGVPGYFGILKSADATAINNYLTTAELAEARFSSTQKLTGFPDRKIQRVAMTYSPKKFLGIKDPMDNSDLYGTDTSNPANTTFYTVYYGSTDGANDPDSAKFKVTVDYVIKFFEPELVDAS